MARKICKCVAMSRLMDLLGAKHAARMHKSLDAVWTPEDWTVHFAEEEAYVLPRLPRDVADRIRMEHEELRAQIKVFGRITNDKALDAHSEYEDEVVLHHLGHLLDNGKPQAQAAGSLRGRMLENRLTRGIEPSRARTSGATTSSGDDPRFAMLAVAGAALVFVSLVKS